MRWDRRSHDLDGALNGRFRYLFFNELQIRSNLPKSAAVIYFMIRALGVSNLKPYFLQYANLLESMIHGHLSFSIDDSALLREF